MLRLYSILTQGDRDSKKQEFFKFHFLKRFCSPLLLHAATVVASSPCPSQLLSLAGKKNERRPGIQSHVTNVGKMASRLPHRQTFDFKPVCHLRSFKCSSVRPLRIVLPSLIVSITFFFTRVKQERSEIALTHAQFSRSATLPTLRSSIWAYVTHVTLDPRLLLFSRMR